MLLPYLPFRYPQYTVCEGVKAAYEAQGTVYVLTTSGELCTLTDGNTLSAPLAEGVKDIRVTDTLSVAGEQELVNVLTNDGRVLAFGQYVHREDHAAYAIADTFVTVGEGVRSLALVPYGTLMLHEDGACTFYGFDPSDDAQKTIDTRTVDTTEPISAIGACESNLILRRADAIYLVGHTAVRLGRDFVGTDTFDSDPYLNHTGR